VLANVINAASQTAIMSEVASEDYSELIDEAVDSIGEGYDLVVLISKSPAEACIAANKTSRIRAVVCKTQSDAAKAKKARANLIIIDISDLTKTAASSIMKGWFGSGTGSAPADEEPEDEKQESAIGNIGKGVLGALSSGAGAIKERSKPKAKAAKEEEEEEEEDDTKKPKGGGIIKSIKYAFGIE
jgi:ribose 5-phosphate isomerase RpiB